MENEEGGDRPAFVGEAGLRRSGGRTFRVRVFSLSVDGCQIELVELPLVGEMVWIKFDGLGSIAGIVGWVAGHVGGVRFENPINEAVFRQLSN